MQPKATQNNHNNNNDNDKERRIGDSFPEHLDASRQAAGQRLVLYVFLNQITQVNQTANYHKRW